MLGSATLLGAYLGIAVADEMVDCWFLSYIFAKNQIPFVFRPSNTRSGGQIEISGTVTMIDGLTHLLFEGSMEPLG